MGYVYLVINENINSGLLKSQVINPIKNIGENQVKLINIHKVGNANKAYANSINLPIAIPYKLFLFNFLFFLTPVFALIYAVVLSSVVKKNSKVVARSYFPSLVTYFLKKIKNIDYIFDSRSLFIDESTLNGNMKESALNFKMWKYFEKKIVCNSYKTTAVSTKQKEFYESLCPNALVELIPCYISPVENTSQEQQLHLRQELGYKPEDIVIVYYGSMDNGWNNIEMYASFFKECESFSYKVLVISQHYNSIKNDDRLELKNITLLNTNHKTSKELLNYLQIGDYGVVLMKKAADWETRLSVKFVEYLNVGLQVIVGEYVGEAARYSREEFSERTVVYKNKDDLQNLKNKQVYLRDKVDALFGFSNSNKVFK
jgi:hypothetical protein